MTWSPVTQPSTHWPCSALPTLPAGRWPSSSDETLYPISSYHRELHTVCTCSLLTISTHVHVHVHFWCTCTPKGYIHKLFSLSCKRTCVPLCLDYNVPLLCTCIYTMYTARFVCMYMYGIFRSEVVSMLKTCIHLNSS